jgi:hypothetical protein
MGKIGDMKRKVEITVPVTTKSAMGAPQKTFAHFCYLFTSRTIDTESPESYVNNRLVRMTRYKYRVHTFTEIDETMQLIDEDITYNILSVDPDPEFELFTEILVERVIE